MRVREVIRLLEADGWYLKRQRGSHRQYQHAVKPGLVTVSGQRHEDIGRRTLTSIQRQAGWRP